MAEKTKRVALVTGSTSGIGLGIAHRLASAGCDIIVHGFAPQNIIDDALAELRSQHNDCKISFAGANFLKEDEIDAMCMEVLKLYPEGIDILINNAGFNEVCLLEDCSMELWHRMIAVHLTSAFMLTKWALPLMKKKVQLLLAEFRLDQWFAGSNPTKKPVSVEQVAALVGFLCSEEAASITGSAHSIDGGYTAR
ncbi:BDHA-like protein [Mya arenaria]|uniref:3-oxoacyl-[acyl-carrier-protein] reductase n=1 Tax=Mya arenaria TaxID=6604 RepID=A0ABY7G2W2_MYAAR|nr:BDHA-like protein [Mya arenaria]